MSKDNEGSRTHSGPVRDEDGHTTAIRTVTEHEDGGKTETDREAGPDLTGGNTSAGKITRQERYEPNS